MIAAGGAPLSGALTAMLLGTRNTLYGLRLAPLLAWTGWRRVLGAHVLIDESTAMSVTRESTPAARLGFLTTGVSIFVLWNLATLVGAVAGNSIGDPRTYGLDAAVGAAFLALLWPRLGGRRNQLVAVAAAAVALGHGADRARRRTRARRRGGRAPRRHVLTKRRAREGLGVIWAAVVAAGVGCYLLKLAGLSVRSRVLERPLVERVADFIPVALLSALIAVQVFSPGPQLVLDARALGLAVAVVLLLLRAPFLVVVFGSALGGAGAAGLACRRRLPLTRTPVGPAPSPVRAPLAVSQRVSSRRRHSRPWRPRCTERCLR